MKNRDRNLAIAGIIATLVTGSPSVLEYIESHGDSIFGAAAPIVALAWPLVVGIFGFFSGWNAKRWSDSRRDAPVAAVIPTASMEDIRCDVMSLSPELKALMLVVADGNEAYARTDDCRYGLHHDERFISQFLSMEKIDGGLTLILPTSRLKPFVDGNRDLFSRVGDTAARRKMPPSEKGTQHHGTTSEDGCPFWWWFDETEVSRVD